MAEKMTYTKALEMVINGYELAPEVAEKLEALKNSLDKKGANRKPTAKQKDNEDLKDRIFEALEILEKGVTVTELQKSDPIFEDFSNQKLSALCNQLYKEDKIDKFVEKGRSYFKVKEG